MNTYYTLNLVRRTFEGTNRDSGTDTQFLFRSHEESRLDEIKRFLESTEYDKLVQEFKQARRTCRSQADFAKLARTTTKAFSFGDVALPFLENDYYGDGSIDYYFIKQEKVPDPSTFV